MLIAHIFKTPLFLECSNNGISRHHDEVTIVNASGPTKDPRPEAPPVIIVMREVGGRKILTAYPAELNGDQWVKEPGKWWMSGGSYIACTDSRFSELCRDLGVDLYGAVSFHDRHEG